MSKINGNSLFLSFSGAAFYLFDVNLKNQELTVDNFSVKSSSQVLQPNASMCIVDCVALRENNVALCFQKELFLYKLTDNDCQLLHSAPIEKKAVCVRFFNKAKTIFVAERSGSVAFYSYETGQLVKEPSCLGHCSMLTDAIITPEDDYVITSDRDEKIRVSNYPNTYNIESYCLGHECFVSSLTLLPSNPSMLVSSSGDSTVRLWDFIAGKQVDFYKHDEAPFMKCVAMSNGAGNILAVQMYKSFTLLLLSVNSNFAIELKKKITTNYEIIDICVINCSMLYLVDDDVPVKTVDIPENGKIDSLLLERMNKAVSTRTRFSPTATFDLLFKREFNNVDAYHERKKARMEKH